MFVLLLENICSFTTNMYALKNILKNRFLSEVKTYTVDLGIKLK